jgi:hypothetical protein
VLCCFGSTADNSFLGSQQLLCSVVVPIAMLLLVVSQPVLIGWFMVGSFLYFYSFSCKFHHLMPF